MRAVGRPACRDVHTDKRGGLLTRLSRSPSRSGPPSCAPKRLLDTAPDRQSRHPSLGLRDRKQPRGPPSGGGGPPQGERVGRQPEYVTGDGSNKHGVAARRELSAGCPTFMPEHDSLHVATVRWPVPPVPPVGPTPLQQFGGQVAPRAPRDRAHPTGSVVGVGAVHRIRDRMGHGWSSGRGPACRTCRNLVARHRSWAWASDGARESVDADLAAAGRSAGLDESVRSEAYYSGLLAWVGCHTDAYEQAKWFGDDIGGQARGPVLRQGSAGAGPPRSRCTRSGGPLTSGPARCVGQVAGRGAASGARGVGEPLARRRPACRAQLGLGGEIRRSLRESFERWDGRGFGGLRGDAIT
jgi:hypothetical protein